MSPTAVDANAGPASGPQVALEPQGNTEPAQRTQPQHEEYQYIDLIRELIDHGEHRPDRYARQAHTYDAI
jgi:thymidylate synthase